jgi:sensor c-di-GMP phosphodiesterase-like protein
MVLASLVAFAGVVALFGGLLWLLWAESFAREERALQQLATHLGRHTEHSILDTRALLASLNESGAPRCSAEHLLEMQDAAISRPWLRAIGYWRAADRQCGVGFLQARELKPPKADRIYASGVIAWWPSPHTESGGVQLFLMRLGEHDAAIDPHRLLDAGPLQGRQVGLWVETLPFSTQPPDARVPLPDSVPPGLTFDAERGLIVSRFSLESEMPIDVVAIEPFAQFRERYQPILLTAGAAALLLASAWLLAVLRYSRERLSLSGELREALAENRIGVEYQPVIELETGCWVGAEALARWTRDNGESVPPDSFIPLAEKAGLVPSITRAVLREITRDLPGLRILAPDLTINLNLCPDDLKHPEFADYLAECLDQAGVPADAIKLEITERALVNSDTARQMISTLRARGHQVAIDDFGTGYSSLSYLQSFELDVLKIDKVFVDAIGSEAAASQVIVHVIDMARSLGLECVAEGVATHGQVRWLIEHGVRLGQGFLFSEPLSADTFADYLARAAR